MIGRHFLSKILKNLQKKFIFGKIAVGKEQPVTLIKITSQLPFTGKLAQKIVKFCCISQRTEAVTVNVKHKFHLELR